MQANVELLLGAGYFLGLTGLAIGSAMLPWRYYGRGILVFIVVFCVGIGWSMKGADGPSGFAVGALHGLIQIVFLSSHAIRILSVVLRKALHYLRSDKPTR